MSEAKVLNQDEVMNDEDLGREEEQEEEEVAVLDDASAEMLLDRIRWADRQYERMVEWYTKQLDKAKAIHDRTVAWAERGLRDYLQMVPVKKTKTQISYELPGGKLVLKAQQPKYDTKDEELVPWLKANKMTDMIQVKEEAKWGELKKTLEIAPDGKSMMTADGEIVPGVMVEQREPKFTVTLK